MAFPDLWSDPFWFGGSWRGSEHAETILSWYNHGPPDQASSNEWRLPINMAALQFAVSFDPDKKEPRRPYQRPPARGPVAASWGLDEFAEDVADTLVDNINTRTAKGLVAPDRTAIHLWPEDRFRIPHQQVRSCPCQRCLHDLLLRRLKSTFDYLSSPYNDKHAPAYILRHRRRTRRPLRPYTYPPDNSHPFFSIYLQLLAVLHCLSRRTLPAGPTPPPSIFPEYPRSSRVFEWVPETPLGADDATDDDADEWHEQKALAEQKKRRKQAKRRRNIDALSKHGRSPGNALQSSRRTMEGTTTANAPTPPHQLHNHSHNSHTHDPFAAMMAPLPPAPSSSTAAAAPPTTSPMNGPLPAPMPSITTTNDPRPASWPDTPTTDKRIDHALPSNVRDSADDTSALPSEAVPKAFRSSDFYSPIFDDPLPNEEDGTLQTAAVKQEADLDFDMNEPTTPSNETTNYAETTTADDTNDGNDIEETGDSLSAYAMLRFHDSYCLITSMNLVLIRDEIYRARYIMQKKEAKKQKKAKLALADYAREPSHRSLLGDDDDLVPQDADDDADLEGRPARGLLSNFSETGGPVSYPANEEEEAELEAQRAKQKRRKNKANSSSANSVAPQDLSIFGGNGDEGDFVPTEQVIDDNGIARDPHEWAQLPIHTARPEDIGKISREHLIFSYDMNRQRWVLNVTGRGVVVNTKYYHRGCEAIELNHADEIFVSTVRMIFELPSQAEEEPASVVEGKSADDYGLESTSPVNRLSHAFDVAGSEADEEEPQPRAPKSVKLKLTNKKKDPVKEAPAPEKGKGKGKNNGKTIEQPDKADDAKSKAKADPSASPETSKKPEKGKKPKTTPADGTGETAAEGSEQPKAESATPAVVPVIDPGSVLADLAPEQMPEKRKGPGRPPKNGLLSKRDESAIKRKQREYERKGEPAPELQVLLNLVRSEQRQKDLAAKAQARGEAAPDTPITSIETEGKNEAGAGPSGTHKDSLTGVSGSPANGGDRTSPKPIRRPKSPSPIKPESEFTEEELKKPNMTYIYIIDEILQNMENSQADLQTIYDKIQKRWPYYKYKVSSVGWQSSVRHNLLQCDRFKEAGKSGKGRFWTINFDHPLDNKKKRPTPPPRPPPQQMANGSMPNGLPHMPPNQYGQPGYPPPYGQAPMNGQGYTQGPQPGQGQYYNSPYQVNGYGPGPHRPPSNGTYTQHAHPPPQRPAPPPQAPAPPPFQRVVDAIMAYRTRFLQQFQPNTPAYADGETQLNRAINYYSDRFHGKEDDGSVSAEEAAKEPFNALKAIFDEHKDLTTAATAAPAPAPPQGQAQQQGPPPQPMPPAANGQMPSTPVTNGQGQQPPVANGQNPQPMPPPAGNGRPQQPMPSVTNGQSQQPTYPQQPVPPNGSYQHPAPPAAGGQGQQVAPNASAPTRPPAMSPPNQFGAPGQPISAPPPTSAGPQSHPSPAPLTAPMANAQQPVSNQQQTSPPGNKPATPQQSAPQAPPTLQTPVAPQQARVNGSAEHASPVISNSTQQAAGTSTAPIAQVSAAAPVAQNGPTAHLSPAPPAPATKQDAPVHSPVNGGGNSAALSASQPPTAPGSTNSAAVEPVPRATVPTVPSPPSAGVKRPAEEDGAREGSGEAEAKRQRTS